MRVRWPHGQATLQAHAAVGSRSIKQLDRELNFTTQVAFNREHANVFTDALQLGVGQILDLLVTGTPAASQILRARVRPMPKMAVRPISACCCGGMLMPAIRAMTVP